jgi:pimeloyl-ACP methyl ester carboxylesterase
MGVFFRDRAFDFETTRVMWYAPVDGADLGEVMSAVGRIRAGDPGSWHDGWHHMAAMLLARAERLLDPTSRGRALLRASNYLRTAEFFLSPDDSRRSAASRLGRDSFDEGLRSLGIKFARSTVPFDNAELETIFFPAPREGSGDLMVVHGGFDSIPEELYFTIGRGALDRGFDVLIYEGPGQGNALRRHGMTFTDHWDAPAAKVLDSLPDRREPASITGVGISYGGRLLARAAAVERRYDGIVLFDYFPRMIDAFRANMPAVARSSFEAMPSWLASLIGVIARLDTQTAWAIQNAKWSFGAADLRQLAGRLAQDGDGDWEAGITADVLILVGEKEHFFPKRLSYEFRDRLVNARSRMVREFTQDEGGHLHCQNGPSTSPTKRSSTGSRSPCSHGCRIAHPPPASQESHIGRRAEPGSQAHRPLGSLWT